MSDLTTFTIVQGGVGRRIVGPFAMLGSREDFQQLRACIDAWLSDPGNGCGITYGWLEIVNADHSNLRKRVSDLEASKVGRVELRGERLARAADHYWPSNHAHYMPEPCAEILTEWLYPLAEDYLALLSDKWHPSAEIDAIRRRWRTDYDRGAHDYTDAGCRILAEHAFRDIPRLLDALTTEAGNPPTPPPVSGLPVAARNTT